MVTRSNFVRKIYNRIVIVTTAMKQGLHSLLKIHQGLTKVFTIRYTLVSGSLPFDGTNINELKEKVISGKYRVPYYMTTGKCFNSIFLRSVDFFLPTMMSTTEKAKK